MNKLSVIFLIGLCAFASCDETEEQSESTLRDKIIQTWSLTDVGYVKASGVDITTSYADLSFTFHKDGTYTSSVNGNLMDGLWRATDSSISTIVLDEVITVNVLELNEDRLLVSFTSEGMINARSKGVSTFEVLLSAK